MARKPKIVEDQDELAADLSYGNHHEPLSWMAILAGDPDYGESLPEAAAR